MFLQRKMKFSIIMIGLLIIVANVVDTMEIDYYKVLRVPRDATDKEIKRAFRKQAIKYHPDKNKAKNAESKFREIAHAYEVLSDPEKRKLYDTHGHSAFTDESDPQGPSPFPFNLNDLFQNAEFDFASPFEMPSYGDNAERPRPHKQFTYEDFFRDDVFFGSPSFESVNTHRRGSNCYIVTKKVGNVLTTYKQCS